MKTSTYNQKYFKHIINKDMICIDMTAGNGNDTLFMARLAKKVYSIDIQKEAIINTKKRCDKYMNITYILDDHQNIDKYVNEKVDVVMFNLGYLPKSESSLHSTKDSTIKAINKAYDLLNDGGYISILIYRGHEGGLAEFHAINELIKYKRYHVIEKYFSYTNIVEPILYIIRK